MGVAMTEIRYRVILYCNKTSDRLIDQVKNGLLQRLSLPDSVLEKLFCGQPIVVQHSVDHEKAMHYQEAIEAAGGICEVEPLTRIRNIDDAGFIERREMDRRNPDQQSEEHKGLERRQGDRRKPTVSSADADDKSRTED